MSQIIISMKKIITVSLLLMLLSVTSAAKRKVVAPALFPDGTVVSSWFSDLSVPDTALLGKKYIVTDFNVVLDSTLIQTERIQSVIDQAAANGGGVVVLPKGVFLSGSLFFKPKTHLFLCEGAVLKGSDDISNFPILPTRMEGQSVKYFAALINADNLDGFTVSGKGVVNGNGLRYWKAFWLRRQFNPDCTNMDEMRPRLLYVSNSKNIRIYNVTLKDSPFWTTHFYKCENVKLLNLRITSPAKPVKAPSTDAVDIDVCTNVHIKNCYMSVNDDAIALKGGKGPFADKSADNGGNFNIIIEDCEFGFCHSALTCGSESVHNRNVILRRTFVDKAQRLFWLKMRPDTPQKYEYFLLEDIKGSATSMLYIRPWTQFFDLKGEKEIKKSYASNITMRNISFECVTAFDIKKSDQFELDGFRFENMQVKAQKEGADINAVITNATLTNNSITQIAVEK